MDSILYIVVIPVWKLNDSSVYSYMVGLTVELVQGTCSALTVNMLKLNIKFMLDG